MKKELNLTKEEKIDFLANLKCFEGIHNDNGFTPVSKKAFVGLGVSIIVFAVAGVILLALNNSLALVMMASMVGSIPVFYGGLRFRDKQLFKKFSNGKITYKDYKRLLKSGEIEKWKSEYSKEIEQKVMAIEGYTVEDYKSIVEDNIISEVEDLIADENIKLDSTRIAEEVKKRIDEHNERQN